MASVHKKNAFTLIEVLIVVVIMAVLAATVIPQFASSTTDAKESTVKFNMHSLRSQIELYRIHHGDYPELSGATLPQMLDKTDAAGSISTTGAYGPYLDAIPPNPFDNEDAIYTATSDPPTGTVEDKKGWQYHEASGGIWPNNPEYWGE